MRKVNIGVLVGSAEISARERQVVALVAEGITDGGIAAVLGVSVHTVKAHCRNVRQRLGFKNRVELAVWWVTGEAL